MGDADSFFVRIANEILNASENFSIRLEEGITALLTGQIYHDPSQPSTIDESVDVTPQDYSDLYGAEIHGPLKGLADGIVGDILKSQSGPESTWEHIQAFRHAITWSEPFIISVVVFQVFMFLLTIWATRTGRGFTPRLIVLAWIAIVVRSAELLNDLGTRHWRLFATQNYFDKHGFFMLVMLSSPLLVDSLIMLIMLLREASQLLVQVKRAELKKKRLEDKKKQAEASETTAASPSDKKKQ